MDYVFEQAGRQVRLYENGLFSDSFPEEERRRLLAEQPELLKDWPFAQRARMLSV